MVTEIYIISGFLGAGKTTLIQKLLKEAFQNEKVALIENDFGEISVDAALLKSSGIEIKEINAGCICCSLSGDFVQALKELLTRFHPDKIIIEPSGVGKLSDVVKACADPRIQSLAAVKSKITVVDVKRCKIYLENFGEFFEDQIQNADVVLLSRTDVFPDRINPACGLVSALNPHAAILPQRWDQLTVADILCPKPIQQAHQAHSCHEHGCDCGHAHVHHAHACGCEHNHTHHEHECSCGHNHAAEEIFDTVTIRTKRKFSIEDLTILISSMEQSAKGTILRAKGIVRGTNGYVNMQYLPGDVQITDCATGGDMLCFIGRNLNRQELAAIFSGE